jgi:hypothetical protein
MSKLEAENAKLREAFKSFNPEALRKELKDFVIAEVLSSLTEFQTTIRDTMKENITDTVTAMNTKFEAFSHNIINEIRTMQQPRHPYPPMMNDHYAMRPPAPFDQEYYTQPDAPPRDHPPSPVSHMRPLSTEGKTSVDTARQPRSPRGSTGSTPPSKQHRSESDDAMIYDAPPPDITKPLLH